MVVWKTKYEVRNWGRREEEGLPWLGGLRVGGQWDTRESQPTGARMGEFEFGEYSFLSNCQLVFYCFSYF